MERELFLERLIIGFMCLSAVFMLGWLILM
jgi:hypothetical protein